MPLPPSPSPAAPERLLAALERRYALVVTLNWLAASVPSALTVLYAESRGLSLAQIGLYGAVYSLTVALLDIPTGGLADTVGRKRVALTGYALATLAKLALLLATSLTTFLLYAVLWGVARALGSGALDAWFVSAARRLDPDVALQPRLARINTLELLALGIGPLVGAGLAAWLGTTAPPLPASWSPMTVVVAVSLALHALTLLVAWRVIHDPTHPHAPLRGALSAALRGLPAAVMDAAGLVRRDAALPTLLALEAVTGWMLAASETYWQPFFATRLGLAGSGTLVFGALLAGCYLAGVLGNLSATPLLRLTGQRADHLGAWTQGAQAAALLLLAWQGSVWLAAALLWLTYFARTAFSSSFLTLYNGRVPDGRRSLMLSVLSVAMFVGFSLGNATLGAVSTHWSIPWAWTLTAGVLLLSVPAYRALRPGARSAD